MTEPEWMFDRGRDARADVVRQAVACPVADCAAPRWCPCSSHGITVAAVHTRRYLAFAGSIGKGGVA